MLASVLVIWVTLIVLGFLLDDVYEAENLVKIIDKSSPLVGIIMGIMTIVLMIAMIWSCPN